jgi:hypothetical protein
MVCKLSMQRQTINLLIYSDGKFGEKNLSEKRRILLYNFEEYYTKL